VNGSWQKRGIGGSHPTRGGESGNEGGEFWGRRTEGKGRSWTMVKPNRILIKGRKEQGPCINPGREQERGRGGLRRNARGKKKKGTDVKEVSIGCGVERGTAQKNVFREEEKIWRENIGGVRLRRRRKYQGKGGHAGI